MQDWKTKTNNKFINDEQKSKALAKMAKEPAKKVALDCFRRPAFYGTKAVAPKHEKGETL